MSKGRKSSDGVTPPLNPSTFKNLTSSLKAIDPYQKMRSREKFGEKSYGPKFVPSFG
jgi:hypothetical protein